MSWTEILLLWTALMMTLSIVFRVLRYRKEKPPTP